MILGVFSWTEQIRWFTLTKLIRTIYKLNWKENRIQRQITSHHRFRIIPEAATGGVPLKRFLKIFANFADKNLYRDLFLIKLQVWKPFFKNLYFEKHLRVAASIISKITVNPKDNGFTITRELYCSFML